MKKLIIGTTVILLLAGTGWLIIHFMTAHQRTPRALPTARVILGEKAPNAFFTTVQNKQLQLSDFRGKKVMLWLVATWCSSCTEGAKVLAENNSQLDNLTIITLKTYGDAGYPGPSITQFAKTGTPNMLNAPNWIWGDLSATSTRLYNQRNYPDIYFLIDKNGIVRHISDAPAATFNIIRSFAHL